MSGPHPSNEAFFNRVRTVRLEYNRSLSAPPRSKDYALPDSLASMLLSLRELSEFVLAQVIITPLNSS